MGGSYRGSQNPKHIRILHPGSKPENKGNSRSLQSLGLGLVWTLLLQSSHAHYIPDTTQGPIEQTPAESDRPISRACRKPLKETRVDRLLGVLMFM